MKKIVLLGFIAASLAACNNSADTTSDKKDSLDSAAKVMKTAIDSTAEKKEDKIDSVTEKKKEALDRADSLKHSKDSVKHK